MSFDTVINQNIRSSTTRNSWRRRMRNFFNVALLQSASRPFSIAGGLHRWSVFFTIKCWFHLQCSRIYYTWWIRGRVRYIVRLIYICTYFICMYFLYLRFHYWLKIYLVFRKFKCSLIWMSVLIADISRGCVESSLRNILFVLLPRAYQKIESCSFERRRQQFR